MNKRQFAKIFSICVYVFCSFSLFSQNQQIIEGPSQVFSVAKSYLEQQKISQFSKSSDNLHSYKLENGFEIYVLEDSENPLIQIAFLSKAGFSVQNQENSGFPELAYRLFFQNDTIQNQIKNHSLRRAL